MIALVTDSNAMLPEALQRKLGALVVPLTVVVDGVAHTEDATLDRAAFFSRLRGGATVTTSAPSPGEILEVYRVAVEDGATEILSVHVGSGYSATVGAARLAASLSDATVHVVDSGQASFACGCCVYAAGEALLAGATAAEAAATAMATGQGIGTVFTVAEIARARAGGRLPVAEAPGIPVVSLTGKHLSEVARVRSLEGAVDEMVRFIAGWPGGPLRVGVGDADAMDAGAALAERVAGLANVADVIRYQMGPSVAAHTGAGSFGAVYHPLAGAR